MSVNISKQKRDVLISKIKELKNFITASPQNKNTQNLLGYLGDILKEINRKKYGLIFEEHQESIDTTLKNNLPILTEEKDLVINNGGELNFLIEGDNLATIQLLEKTYKGKIDIIYIDPPYNTGNKDFIYDDNYVDSTDEFKHSKWLSFMDKRLKIAKQLLADTGVLFISIDDNEQSELSLLCKEIFGINNFETLIWQKVTDDSGKLKITYRVRTEHEYILVCYKNKEKTFFNKYIDKRNYKNEYTNPDNDKRGPYKQAIISDTEEKSNKDSICYYTITSPTGIRFTRQWHVEKWEMDELIADNRIYWGIHGDSVPSLKAFINEPKLSTPSSLLSNLGTAKTAGNTIEEIFNNRTAFTYPKPVELIDHIIKICTQTKYSLNPKMKSPRKVFFPNADMHIKVKDTCFTILDFFAGSGTTGQAVLELNKEDGGHRKFILCTNNENNICRDITYQRLKTVITGKRKDGSTYSDGLPGSLKYLKVGFIPVNDQMYYEYADQLLENIRTLVELENAVDLNSNKSVSIIIDDEELEDFINSIEQHSECKSLYLGHDVLISSEQEQKLHKNGIEIKTVPEYYYPDTEPRGSDEH